jgi:predicted permease
MGELITIIAPVFLVTAFGYVATKRELISHSQIDGLVLFTQKFAIPCLLFYAIANIQLSQYFAPKLLLSYYLPSISMFFLGLIGARMVFKRPLTDSVAIGFACLYSNSLLLGLPITERAYGTEALQPVYALIAVHAPYCYIIGITTMEIVRAGGRPIPETLRSIAKEILTNSLTIGLMLGFAVNLSGIALPQFIWSPIQMMVSAAIPAALFALGGILTRYKLSDRIGETVVVLVLKLFVHPGIAYVLATQVFDLSIDFTRAAVMAGAMAPGVNVFLFANIYDRAKGTAANSVLLGTAASILSISFWLYVLGL